jgi:hypothetical protein
VPRTAEEKRAGNDRWHDGARDVNGRRHGSHEVGVHDPDKAGGEVGEPEVHPQSLHQLGDTLEKGYNRGSNLSQNLSQFGLTLTST